MSTERQADFAQVVGPLTARRLAYLSETEVARSWMLKNKSEFDAMAKATKFLRKQADKAERKARVTADANLLNLAKAYRTQADVLKAKRKQVKKRR
ncbi:MULTISPECIES: hypothetical protein [unclassified Bradyrhizobium]|uniref:hypothetical protein n=1 Tax=unclassified Bradyrhizobium TaxID=2631580 RepID=UPI001BA56C99|nr:MULTISPECIES: hypothetical protein [unclassified Bradyrhizobium]MBR1208798.1 hypothetical protein [Bradyrhizobium sp. AUGA SZCCT0124]MBR1317106.1 hypothetical protein [Bradyrhizobium sp. AUGA SZCCT0051]MBR1345420.1 hypothetical protein [Bradyrhizobium sp. AUGA SZCCT0105]MBR1360208.1 hypothetical protein [Bradyrhizobium sp. AUGA SZCCT0045]